MAKYKLKRACFFNNQLFPAGEMVDFGDSNPPKDAVEVPTTMVEKAKAAAKATGTKTAEQEDALLKGSK